MKRRTFLTGFASGAALASMAGAAMALSYADDVVTQLVTLGFSDIMVETTWLGRIKISASRVDGRREIVLNPRTGEILRDVFTSSSADGVTRQVIDDVTDDNGGHSGSGDDGGGDDNSGSGGSGSGSGGDDSGHGDDGGSGGDDGDGGGGG